MSAGDPTVRIIAPSPDTSQTDEREARPGAYPSSDGRFVATVVRDDRGTRIDVTADAGRVASFPLAAPDGDQLVNSGKGVAATTSSVPLTVGWSPDSKYLAFGSVSGAPWTLNVVSAADWRVDGYAVEGGYVGELAWSPDGSLLAISTYQIGRTDHSVLMFDVSQRTVRYLIDGCAIVWAPDGRYLAVHREPREESGVWITSADGASRISATPDPMAFPISWVDSSA